MNPFTESPIMKNRNLTAILAALTAGAAFIAVAPDAEARNCIKIRINPAFMAAQNANRRAQQRTFESNRSNTSQPNNPNGPRIVEDSDTQISDPSVTSAIDPVTYYSVSPLWNEAYSFGVSYDPALDGPLGTDDDDSHLELGISYGLELSYDYSLSSQWELGFTVPHDFSSILTTSQIVADFDDAGTNSVSIAPIYQDTEWVVTFPSKY